MPFKNQVCQRLILNWGGEGAPLDSSKQIALLTLNQFFVGLSHHHLLLPQDSNQCHQCAWPHLIPRPTRPGARKWVQAHLLVTQRGCWQWAWALVSGFQGDAGGGSRLPAGSGGQGCEWWQRCRTLGCNELVYKYGPVTLEEVKSRIRALARKRKWDF